MRRSNTAISPLAFSGGTFVVKQPNYSNYYAQAMMHRQAKQQALSQYYDRVQSSINPAGVRDQDLEGWQKKADDWNKWGIEHRDELVDPRRDGGKALNQFNAMHRDLLSDTQKSKQAAAKELTLSKIYADPNKAKLATDKDMQLAHGLSASIYDKNHYKDDGVTPHDLTEFSFNAPAFDINKQRAVTQMVNRGLKKDRVFGKPQKIDANTMSLPYTEQHSTQNLKSIADRTGDAYDGDPSMQSYYQNKTLAPDEFDRLNQAYKSVYGKDQDIGTDFKKHAMADQILQNSQQNTGAEMRSIPQPRVGRSGGAAGQQYQDMVNWVKGTASAIRTGNENELKRFGSALYQGPVKNSKYQDVELGPFQTGATNDAAGIKKGAIFHHQDHQYVYDTDPNTGRALPTGQYKDVNNTTNLASDDPYLEQKLTGYYQQHMGAVRKLNTTPFYQDQQDDDQGVPAAPVAPPPAVKPKPTAPVDPDALLLKYGAK